MASFDDSVATLLKDSNYSPCDLSAEKVTLVEEYLKVDIAEIGHKINSDWVNFVEMSGDQMQNVYRRRRRIYCQGQNNLTHEMIKLSFVNDGDRYLSRLVLYHENNPFWLE